MKLFKLLIAFILSSFLFFSCSGNNPAHMGKLKTYFEKDGFAGDYEIVENKFFLSIIGKNQVKSMMVYSHLFDSKTKPELASPIIFIEMKKTLSQASLDATIEGVKGSILAYCDLSKQSGDFRSVLNRYKDKYGAEFSSDVPIFVVNKNFVMVYYAVDPQMVELFQQY